MNAKKIARWVLGIICFLAGLGCGSVASGLLLFIAGILFLPIDAISEKIKHPINIILAVILLIAGIMTSPSVSTSDKSPTTTSSPEIVASSSASPEPTPDPTTTPEPSPTPESESSAIEDTTSSSSSDATATSVDDVAALFEVAIKDNFENYRIDTTDTYISVNVWSDNIAAGTVYAKEGYEEPKKAWNNLVTNNVNLCNSLVTLAQTCGRDDLTVFVNVLNDQDLSKTLLTVADGIVWYNCVED